MNPFCAKTLGQLAISGVKKVVEWWCKKKDNKDSDNEKILKEVNDELKR